jgi:hypothetical protein
MFNIPQKRNVDAIERNGVIYYFSKFGSETHGKPSFILWISSKLIDPESESLVYPLRAKLIQGNKNLVLKPVEIDNDYIFEVHSRAGFRGQSTIEILEPQDAVMLKFYQYHSPLGNLGISECGLILTPRFPIKLKVSRTGRTYDEPKNFNVIVWDNTLEYDILITEDPDEIDQLLNE